MDYGAENTILVQSFLEWLSVPPAASATLIIMSVALILSPFLGGLNPGPIRIPEIKRPLPAAITGIIFLIMITLGGISGFAEDGKPYWIARKEREQRDVERIAKEAHNAEFLLAEQERTLQELCRTGINLPLNLQNTGDDYSKGGRFDLGFRRYVDRDKSGNCREKFHANWIAGDGHFFYLEENSPLVTERFISRDNRHGYDRGFPSSVPATIEIPSGQALSRIYVSGYADAGSSSRSKSCGVEITMALPLVKNECAPFVGNIAESPILSE